MSSTPPPSVVVSLMEEESDGVYINSHFCFIVTLSVDIVVVVESGDA